MSEQAQLLGVLAGVAVLAVTAGLALRAERGRRVTRLATYLGNRLAVESLAEVAARVTFPDNRHPILRWARLGIQPHKLAQAGWLMTPRRFLHLQLGAGLFGFVLARLYGIRVGYQGLEFVACSAAGILAGLALPRLLLWRAKKQRTSQFEKNFSAALDGLANGIQAGLSLPQALEVVSRDMPAPLGTELKLVTRELGLGLGLEQALNNLADRVPLKDVDIFVAAIHIQFRTGGNLSAILRTLAHTIRERLRIRGEVKALTAQAKLSAYIVTLLPIAIALAIKFINPIYFAQIIEPGSMRLLLYGAVSGMVGGYYAMMRIADIEV